MCILLTCQSVLKHYVVCDELAGREKRYGEKDEGFGCK